jgi:hypothetical protein
MNALFLKDQTGKTDFQRRGLGHGEQVPAGLASFRGGFEIFDEAMQRHGCTHIGTSQSLHSRLAVPVGHVSRANAPCPSAPRLLSDPWGTVANAYSKMDEPVSVGWRFNEPGPSKIVRNECANVDARAFDYAELKEPKPRNHRGCGLVEALRLTAQPDDAQPTAGGPIAPMRAGMLSITAATRQARAPPTAHSRHHRVLAVLANAAATPWARSGSSLAITPGVVPSVICGGLRRRPPPNSPMRRESERGALPDG